jgi:hypothetical protein
MSRRSSGETQRGLLSRILPLCVDIGWAAFTHPLFSSPDSEDAARAQSVASFHYGNNKQT